MVTYPARLALSAGMSYVAARAMSTIHVISLRDPSAQWVISPSELDLSTTTKLALSPDGRFLGVAPAGRRESYLLSGRSGWSENKEHPYTATKLRSGSAIRDVDF